MGALSPIDAVCTSCGTGFNQAPKRSFLGFQKLTCPNCQIEVTYPLTSGFRTTYFFIIALMISMILYTFSQGGVGFPGGIGIAMIYALVKDWGIRKRIAETTN
jgi:hypothetical protein